MTRDLKYLLLLLIAVLCGFLLGNCGKDPQLDEVEGVKIKVKTDTLKVVDTLKFYAPKPVKVFKIRHDTLRIAVAGDTLATALPIESKVYKDSLYTAYISGYNAQLDSIYIRSPTTYITTNTEKIITRNKRFNIGVIGGFGLGLKSKAFEPFVGVGVSYSLK